MNVRTDDEKERLLNLSSVIILIEDEDHLSSLAPEIINKIAENFIGQYKILARLSQTNKIMNKFIKETEIGRLAQQAIQLQPSFIRAYFADQFPKFNSACTAVGHGVLRGLGVGGPVGLVSGILAISVIGTGRIVSKTWDTAVDAFIGNNPSYSIIFFTPVGPIINAVVDGAVGAGIGGLIYYGLFKNKQSVDTVRDEINNIRNQLTAADIKSQSLSM